MSTRVLKDQMAPPTSAKPRQGRQVFVAFLAAAMLGLLPSLINAPLLFTLLTQAVIASMMAVGVGFLIRQNGQVSFGHALYFGMGAYLFALLTKSGTVPVEGALVLAIAVPAVFGFLLGLVIVRIEGVAFGMLSLAVAQGFYELVVRWRELANGDDGMSVPLPPRLLGLPLAVFQEPGSMFLVCWLLLLLVIFVLWLVARSHFGTLTVAIRENEERARFIGYTTTLPRALVVAISAAVAALGGVLFALYNSFVSPDILHWSLSGSALVMAIIGGTRLVWGPALGAAIFFFFKDAAGDLTEHWPAVIGVTLIIVTVLLPKGISGAALHLYKRRTNANSKEVGR